MLTHDRWQRIKEIFHSAREKTTTERLEFLNEVCGDDQTIREEVEALLTADDSKDDFLSAPAYEFAAGMLAGEALEFSVGQKVGRYTILCPLGTGGMGQIYLAQDEQLRRKIALKMIAHAFATDSRRVLRFQQEARAASALNHPNVCVIHETGVAENDLHFIAMEYIQGITLRDKIKREQISPLEALHITRQVANALGAAHAAGIVHRDIKPENIMLRPDGYVKVLDFGLAKLTEVLPEQQRHLGEIATEAGKLIGTVKYMSPEQLREMELDERTDIWSLGVVLYEMLTQNTPFDARSPNDTIALILGPQPPILSLSEQLPDRFREILKKAIEKDRDVRYQTVTKLAADLNTLQRELEREHDDRLTTGQTTVRWYRQPATAYETPHVGAGSAIFTQLKSQAITTADFLLTGIRSHRAATLFTGVTGVLALLVILPYVTRFIEQFINRSPGSIMRQKALTSAGTSICSAISADGRLVAHAEEQGGKQLLMVTSTATFGTSVVVPPQEVKYLGLTFSPDNNYLYFTRKENSIDGILYRLALPGAPPVKLKEGVDSPVSFSPQGDRFAFVRYNETTNEYSLVVSDTNGANERVISSRQNGYIFSIYGVSWSPDGNTLLCPTGSWEKGWHMDLVAIDLETGREQLIGNQSWFSIQQVAWQEDMSSIVVSAQEREASPHQLWRIHLPRGELQPITNDLNDYRGVSLSGGNIVTLQTDLFWRIWIANLDKSQKASPILSGTGPSYGLTWTSKGKIVFSSMAQDRLNISQIDPDGSNQVQLTVNAGDNFTPASSPDGRFIVFSSNRTGGLNIWRMNADDGSGPTQLTKGEGDFYPSVSPDNQWVAYDDRVESKLRKVPLTAGESITVGEKCRMPTFSPDSQSIACRYDRISDSDDVVVIFPAQGGEPLKHFNVPNHDWQSVQWLPNGRVVSYINNADGYSNIWTYDLYTEASKQITFFNSDHIYAYAWSPNYDQIACLRGTTISNVTMISE